MKIIIVPIVAAGLSLAACTGAAPQDQQGVEVTARDLPNESGEQAPEEDAAEPEASGTDMTTSIGSTFTWEDGVTVKVEEAGNFTPGEWDVYEPGYAAHRLYKITVQNDGSAPLEMSGGTILGASGGAATDEVYGTYNGSDIGGFPYNALMPGKSQSFFIALGVMDPDDVQIEVSPGWEHSYAYFLSEGAGDAA